MPVLHRPASQVCHAVIIPHHEWVFWVPISAAPQVHGLFPEAPGQPVDMSNQVYQSAPVRPPGGDNDRGFLKHGSKMLNVVRPRDVLSSARSGPHIFGVSGAQSRKIADHETLVAKPGSEASALADRRVVLLVIRGAWIEHHPQHLLGAARGVPFEAVAVTAIWAENG